MVVSIPTLIADIVTRIRINMGNYNVGTYSNDAPYFEFGSHQYIANVLDQKDNSPATYDKLYPFVGLVLDIPENRKPRLNVYAELNLSIVLATGFNKKAELTNSQREQSSFKDILYPLYEDLLVQMYNTNQFIIGEGSSGLDIPHTKTDLYFLGTQPSNQNEWNRFVDAIEIKITNLSLSNLENC